MAKAERAWTPDQHPRCYAAARDEELMRSIRRSVTELCIRRGVTARTVLEEAEDQLSGWAAPVEVVEVKGEGAERIGFAGLAWSIATGRMSLEEADDRLETMV